MLAVRMRGVGCYFGRQVEIDGVERPREAMRELLRIAGFNVSVTTDEGYRRTTAVAGHVLRDISLDIEAGSVVCLTGASGSGKTVLLRILAGATAPTAGSVEIYDEVDSLLSIGSNLDARLTPHENIRRAPRLAAASPDDAARFAADVLDFGELHEFEHAPLRTLSTGMTLRLSVALALSGRPRIVLIDDVLSVGDIAFQQKCIDRVHALKDAGSTIIVAFSDDQLVTQLATRVITLGGGRVVADAPPAHWHLTNDTRSAADVEWVVAGDLPEDDVMALRSIALEVIGERSDSQVELSAVFEAKAGGLRCRPFVEVMRERVVLFRSLFPQFVDVDAKGRRLTFTVAVPAHLLPDGSYTIGVNMVTMQGSSVFSMKAQDGVKLTIRREVADGAAAMPAVMMRMPWEIERVAALA